MTRPRMATKGFLIFKAKPPGFSSAKLLFNKYKHNAKVRNIDFTLSFTEFLTITRKNCYICNRKPATKLNHAGLRGSYTYNGIDRLDNNLGYTSANSRPCCWLCNRMKMNMTLDEFKKHIQRIVKHENSSVRESDSCENGEKPGE